MLPIAFSPDRRNASPLYSNEPSYMGAIVFIRSSSIAPPVVTITSTILCSTRNRTVSRSPHCGGWQSQRHMWGNTPLFPAFCFR